MDVSNLVPKGSLGVMHKCLVGRWREVPTPHPLAKEVESWAKVVWRLKGGILVAFLHEDLMFFEFTLPKEVSRALVMEPKSLRGGLLDVERWNPDSGCTKNRDRAKEVWIRVVGLPPNLWTREILKQIREGCGGFISMDKETALRTEVKWARLRVSLKGEIRLSSLNILARERSYELQIWWELQLWVAGVYLARGVSRLGVSRSEEEDKPPSCANQCAWSDEEGDFEGGRLGRGGMCQEVDRRGLVKSTCQFPRRKISALGSNVESQKGRPMCTTSSNEMDQNPLCEPLEVREGPSKGFDGFGPMVGFNERGGSPLEPISDGLVCEPLEVRKGPNLDGIGPQVGSPIEPNSSHKRL